MSEYYQDGIKLPVKEESKSVNVIQKIFRGLRKDDPAVLEIKKAVADAESMLKYHLNYAEDYRKKIDNLTQALNQLTIGQE